MRGPFYASLGLAVLLTAASLSGQTPTTPPQAGGTAPVLSELDRLRLENHQLRLRVLQLEAQMQTEALSEERARLDAAVRAAYPGWAWDWQTGRLVRPEPTPETPR